MPEELLSFCRYYNIATGNIFVIHVICAIEESVRNFCTKYLANKFRFECKKIFKKGRRNSENLCNELKT